jgi:hypothetical protein
MKQKDGLNKIDLQKYGTYQIAGRSHEKLGRRSRLIGKIFLKQKDDIGEIKKDKKYTLKFH